MTINKMFYILGRYTNVKREAALHICTAVSLTGAKKRLNALRVLGYPSSVSLWLTPSPLGRLPSGLLF